VPALRRLARLCARCFTPKLCGCFGLCSLIIAFNSAYRFGLDSACRDLYLWPADPAVTDSLFWHARGSHIHVLFNRNKDGDFLPERAITTLRHVDDIGIVQPVDGRPLGGSFHFDIEPIIEYAKSGMRNLFTEAHWFWINRRDSAGSAWKALNEKDIAAYLKDWDGLLEAFGNVCEEWNKEMN